MPKMDGLEFLGRLMRLRPMPVVMISSHTARGSEVTLQALETGAFDFVTKPQADNAAMLHAYTEDVRDKIRAAFHARGRVAAPRPAATRPSGGVAAVAPAGFSQRLLNGHVIAIGASTGGTEAIKDVLVRLPQEMPPIVMVQHMPESFTPSFAKRLDGLSSLTVIEARGGERLRPGTAYLAPGHSHMLIRKVAGGYVTELSSAEPVNRHRPAVDVLFDSVAAELGVNATGIVLTGMGKDGAKGLLAMRQAGAWTIGQDEASCVVYGMPREAALMGALDEVVTLRDIATHLLTRLQRLDRGQA
jgi:two-component system chemotaxis response regulator CheB